MEKMMKKIILILIFFSSMFFAQEKLTLEKAIDLAVKNNYNILIAKNSAEINENNNHPGNANLLPRVDVSAEATYSKNDIKTAAATNTTKSTFNRFGISASYVLFDGLANLNNYKILKSLDDIGKLSLRLQIESTILAVTQAYYNLALAYENKLISTEALDISRERYERVKARAEYGKLNKIELLSAEVDLSSDSVSFYTAELQFDQARRELNLLLNQNIETQYKIETSVPENINYDLNNLISDGMVKNTELLLSAKNVNISELEKNITTSAFLPTVSLTSSYGYNQTVPNIDVKYDDPNSSFSAGIELRWNLFNGFRNSIQRQNSELKLKNEKYLKLYKEENFKKEIANTYTNYSNNKLVLEVEKKNLKTAELNFERTKDLFNLGKVINTTFREAQLNLIRAKTKIISAKYQIKIAESRLLKLSGNLIE